MLLGIFRFCFINSKIKNLQTINLFPILLLAILIFQIQWFMRLRAICPFERFSKQNFSKFFFFQTISNLLYEVKIRKFTFKPNIASRDPYNITKI